MKFLAVSNNRADPTEHLAAEGARMAELIANGTVEQAFVKTDYSGAVLIAEADDVASLQEALGTLPLVANGLTSFTFTEITAL
jgi:hypothetical protein